MAENNKPALVVDDEAPCRRVTARYLQNLGYTVFTAESVAAARRKFEPGRYRLLVSDVGLPDGDGIGLAAELRDLDSALRILIASGDPSNIERARDAGFKQVLHKPFDADQLKALLDGNTQA
ncbi:response regulator [Elusimicrobiota bacterium]